MEHLTLECDNKKSEGKKTWDFTSGGVKRNTHLKPYKNTKFLFLFWKVLIDVGNYNYML